MTKYHQQDSIVSITLYKDNADYFGRHFVKMAAILYVKMIYVLL